MKSAEQLQQEARERLLTGSGFVSYIHQRSVGAFVLAQEPFILVTEEEKHGIDRTQHDYAAGRASL